MMNPLRTHPFRTVQTATWWRSPLLVALASSVIGAPAQGADSPIGFHFQPVEHWCRGPSAETLGSTHGDVVVDSKGRVYCTTDTRYSILVYSPDGKLENVMGQDFVGLHGLTFNIEDGKEYLYAAHTRGRQVVKFDPDGNVVWTLGVPVESGLYDLPRSYKPTAVAVAPNGDIYIADGYGKSYIHQYDAKLNYLRSFGGKGTSPGQFNVCHAIEIDRRYQPPRLLICDRENNRMQHFDLQGNFISVFAQGLRQPARAAIYGSYVAVAELGGRVTILDKTNQPVLHLGNNPDPKQRANFRVPPQKWRANILTAPHGCFFDAQGDLYVTDWNYYGRLTKWKRIP